MDNKISRVEFRIQTEFYKKIKEKLNQTKEYENRSILIRALLKKWLEEKNGKIS